jgi:hypothetical protein
MNDSENKPYFTSFSAKYSALTPDDKEIVINSLNSISDMLLMGRISNMIWKNSHIRYYRLGVNLFEFKGTNIEYGNSHIRY